MRSSLPSPFRRSTVRVLLLSAALLGGCDVTEPSPPVPEQVRIAADSVQLFVGEGALVPASALDARGNPVPEARLRWASSDPEVARVDSTGHVFALRPGRATVTASIEGGTAAPASVPVRVDPRPDRLELPQDTLVLKAPGPAAGCEQQVAPTLYDREGKPVRSPTPLVTYSIEDTSVAGYRKPSWGTGALYLAYIFGKRPGETRLIAASGSYRDTAVVRVLPGTPTYVRIYLPPGQYMLSLASGDTAQLEARVLNECGGVMPDAEPPPVFSSGDPSVVEVSPGGEVVARGPGSTYVYAARGSARDSVLAGVSQ